MALNISMRDHGAGRMVLQVRGDVELGDVEHLRAKITYASTWRPYQLILDLRAVTFLGSAGLACLTLASLEVRTDGCTLYVIADHLAVTHPIRTAGLAGTLELHSRIDDVPPPEVPRSPRGRSASLDGPGDPSAGQWGR
jgi:anti-anti-sigma factor